MKKEIIKKPLSSREAEFKIHNKIIIVRIYKIVEFTIS